MVKTEECLGSRTRKLPPDDHPLRDMILCGQTISSILGPEHRCGIRQLGDEIVKIMSVVTFKVKDGYQEEFIEAYRKAGSTSANFWRFVAVDEDTFVSINELPAVEDVVEREEVGIPWLDTVEHMLVKFGESRTSAFSGLVIEEYNNPDWTPDPGQHSG